MIVKGPHYPQYSDDIIKIYSLMIYSDILLKKNVVGDTLNYQSFPNLQFKKMLKKLFP